MEKRTILKQQKPRYSSIQIFEGLEGVMISILGYLTFFLKPLRARWGLTKKEANRIYPGDEKVPNPKTKFTHGIEIKAPAESVWPWVAQIGQGRGGFYSYEALENLAGLNIYNSDEVLPEFQNPFIGELISFGSGEPFPLVICEQGRSMAIEAYLDLDTQKSYNPKIISPRNYLHLTWLWHIEPIDKNRSRFISRNRLDYNPSFKNKLLFGLMAEPAVFAMDRKMCLGIKKRAEKIYKNG